MLCIQAINYWMYYRYIFAFYEVPVSKICQIDVQGQVGHETKEECLEVGIDHVAQLSMKFDSDGHHAFARLVDGRVGLGRNVLDEKFQQKNLTLDNV